MYDKKKHPHKEMENDADIPSLQLFHEKLLESSQIEKPVTDVYDVFDMDLARDNMENDLTEREKQDLQNLWP